MFPLQRQCSFNAMMPYFHHLNFVEIHERVTDQRFRGWKLLPVSILELEPAL